MRKRRILPLLITAVVIMSTTMTGFAAKKTTASKTNLPPYVLQMYVTGGGPQKDAPLVVDALNKYLKSKINATIVINYTDWTTYNTKLPVMFATDEPFDICFTSYWAGNYTVSAHKGAFYPMDSLLTKYAPKTRALFTPAYLNGARVDGKIYAIPANKDKAKNYGLLYNKTLADAMGIDMKKIKTIDDVIPMLRLVKAKNPNITPFGYNGLPLGDFTTQMDAIPGVSAYLDSTKNDNKIYWGDGSPLLEKAMRLARQMYLDKLVRADAATYSSTNADEDFKTGKVFCEYNQLKPGLAEEQTTANTHGQVYGQVSTDKPIYGNGEVTGSMMAISKNSKDPARAMMFLELLNTDPYVNNLINYGIEGTDYTKVSKNIIKIADKPGYTFAGLQWIWGNQYINYIIQGENPDKWKNMDLFNRMARPSAALGFVFNPDPVQSELAAYTQATKEYTDALARGVVDVDTALPKHLKALKAAGADKIIAEVQKQYDAWRDKNKK